MVDRLKFAGTRPPLDSEGLEEILTWDLWKRWEHNALPESKATGELGFALDVLYHDGPPELVDRFLDRCIAVGERVEAEKFLDQERFDSVRNYKQAFLMTAVCFARWLKSGVLETTALLAGASLLELHWGKRKDWGDDGEAQWLKAVRLCLIAGDEERARRLLAHKHKFLYHTAERDALATVFTETSRAEPELRRVFDFLRDPYCKFNRMRESTTQNFELGCIWVKYYEGGLDDWKKVIRAVAE